MDLGVQVAVVSVMALVTSALLTGVVRHLAWSRGLVDIPNSRSSHTQVTARGGGLAVVLTTITGLIALRSAGAVSVDLFMAIAVGGGVVALVGFLDDRHSIRPAVRFVVHVGAALWALKWLGGLPTLRLGNHLVQLGWGGYVVGTLGIVWILNLFNFMDGIDGIATGEAAFVSAAGALFALSTQDPGGVSTAAWMFAWASTGFLCWNWPPAKVFLGDVGSGYLGYVIAVLALAAGRDNPASLWVWLILGGVFFVDATVTLVRRVLRGERVSEAHRSHAYQWLARRWGSHAKVTRGVLIVDVLWLLPCAVVAARRPDLATAIVVFAFAPLAVLAVAISGRREAYD